VLQQGCAGASPAVFAERVLNPTPSTLRNRTPTVDLNEASTMEVSALTNADAAPRAKSLPLEVWRFVGEQVRPI